MQHLGTLKGTGQLQIEADGTWHEDIDYEIDIWLERPGGLKKAEGWICGGSTQLLWDLVEAGKARLQLEDGTETEIVPKQWNVGDDCVDVHANGPFPGF